MHRLETSARCDIADCCLVVGLPDDLQMRVTSETMYQSIYVQDAALRYVAAVNKLCSVEAM